jgi:NAD(P)-dependent dehydrogenase (short-subunit alcohol dehydrogenase family)
MRDPLQAAPDAVTAMDKGRLRDLFDMTGRVVIVTGGTRGIGLALAEGYVAAGAKVVVASRKPEACREAADHLRAMGGDALGVPTHLGELDSLGGLVKRTLDAYSGIDVLVNNAASSLTQQLGQFTPEAWAKSFDVNPRGPVFLVQEALPALKTSPCAPCSMSYPSGRFSSCRLSLCTPRARRGSCPLHVPWPPNTPLMAFG